MVRMINTVETDGFLESPHDLLLMDDIVILSTSRDRILKKCQIAQLFCKEYGMSLNVKKIKFMIINNTPGDNVPIISEGFTVAYPTFILVLISQMTSTMSAIKLHIENKRNKVRVICEQEF